MPDTLWLFCRFRLRAGGAGGSVDADVLEPVICREIGCAWRSEPAAGADLEHGHDFFVPWRCCGEVEVGTTGVAINRLSVEEEGAAGFRIAVGHAGPTAARIVCRDRRAAGIHEDPVIVIVARGFSAAG